MPPSTAQGLIIPTETRTKHPKLVELIVGSESMNDEERQYWINILPSMSTDQIQSLNQILTTEKDQLAAINKKYSKEGAPSSEKMEQRRERQKELKQKEQTFEKQDDRAAEELLEKIEGKEN